MNLEMEELDSEVGLFMFCVWLLTPKRCNIQYEDSVIEISPP